MEKIDRTAVASMFATALEIAEEVAPLLTATNVDRATAGAHGQRVAPLLRTLFDGLDQVPSITDMPPEVLSSLQSLARIVRGTRTECISYGDVALHLARSEMATHAEAGWQALVKSKPANQGLLAWADAATDTMAELAPETKDDPGDRQPGVDASVPPKPKRRGRKKPSDETVQREAQLKDEWERARDSGEYKGTFAKEKGMSLKKFDALLDRVAVRKSRSE